MFIVKGEMTENLVIIEFFAFLFKAIIIVSSILVIASRNPVFSVLLLVFTFLNTAILLMFMKIQYFSILLILVYLGAVAVLFLFVVMLLNIRIFEVTEQTIKFTPFIFFFVFSYFVVALFFFTSSHFSFIEEKINVPFWVDIAFEADNIRSLASFMFTHGFTFILLSSIILLMAMLSSIFLTLVKPSKMKIQDDYIQLFRENRTHILLAKNKQN